MARLSGRGGHDFKLNWSRQTFLQIDGLIMTFINIIVKKICLKCSSTAAQQQQIRSLIFSFGLLARVRMTRGMMKTWCGPSPVLASLQYSNVTNTCQIILTANKDIHSSIGQTFPPGENWGRAGTEMWFLRTPLSSPRLTAEQSKLNL